MPVSIRVFGPCLLHPRHACLVMVLGVPHDHGDASPRRSVDEPPAVQAAGLGQCRDDLVGDVLDTGREVVGGLFVEAHDYSEHCRLLRTR